MDFGSMNAMLVSLFFSAVGMGYFIHGKKQARFLMLVTGSALMVYPYFVPGLGMMILVGMALMILPFALARFF